ncbi:hypothetical protein BASA81_013244 [Batrachochytrium salamandrivorans]|nr:hypothetical protein BASA81_013244 [Batrachochytrium salamandrivorans]
MQQEQVAVGTRGWVFNGPQLYACRVEQVEPKGYFVHYEGWKKKWDDWVKPSEFLEDNEENRLRSEQIKNSLKRAKSSPASTPETKRQKSDAEEEQEEEEGGVREMEDFALQHQEVEEIYSEPAMRVLLPDELKALLVRDWENYMLNDKQISLPCQVSVKKILTQYAESKKLNQTGYLQLAQALEIYFNRALPAVLLYKDEDVGEGGEFSERFGAEHLLRMCVRLPNLMTSGLDEVDSKQLCVKVNDLLKHVARKRKEYFSNTYVSRKQPIATPSPPIIE